MKSKALNIKRLLVLFLLSGAVVIYSCSSVKNSSKKQAKATISATTEADQGNGTISFVQNSSEVEMKLELNFPSKAGQTVAVHIHEHGDCGNAGNDAHGHWNPTKSNHGKWGQGEFHLGDIGNVVLDANGNGTYSLKTNLGL